MLLYTQALGDIKTSYTLTGIEGRTRNAKQQLHTPIDLLQQFNYRLFGQTAACTPKHYLLAMSIIYTLCKKSPVTNLL